MKPFPSSFVSLRRARRALLAVAVLGLAGASLSAQDNNAPRGDGRRGGGNGGGQEDGRRSFNPADMQARMLAGLRERMGVTSDEEWTVISERVMKVSELRRSMGGGMASAMAFRGPGGPGGGGDSRGSFRGRSGGSSETEALQSAVADKLPDAELKARLTKLRETRKANEKKLEQAQEDLRAVLTVRQEALLVLAGLLP